MRRGILFGSGAFLAVATLTTSTSWAAPVWLQDYEAPGNLDAPFNFQPDASGSTEGILNDDAPFDPGTSTIAINTTTGAIETAQSATLNIVDEAGVSGSNGTAYHIRLIPNSGASVSAANPQFATNGYVGFYLRAEPSSAAALLEVAPLLEDSGGTLAASGGILKPVIADGQWHLYEWNMDDLADFPNTFETFYGGAPAAETLEALASFDSIAILSRGTDGSSSAILEIDQIGYDNAGHLPAVPEPASLAGLAIMGLMMGRRRRA